MFLTENFQRLISWRCNFAMENDLGEKCNTYVAVKSSHLSVGGIFIVCEATQSGENFENVV